MTITSEFWRDVRDGQKYRVVTIQDGIWLAENLNFDIFGSAFYDNDSTNGERHGRLYTWEAAIRACPPGWHLPSDEEWKELEISLGMDPVEANLHGPRLTGDVGNILKSPFGWENGGNGSYDVGFCALPSGQGNVMDEFTDLGKRCYFWTGTEHVNPPGAWFRILGAEASRIGRAVTHKDFMMSVRCIKD